ncbi:MAG TPA: SDR family NAD(P)-dependent oxidoreductase [Caulobacteraceae bacterium]
MSGVTAPLALVTGVGPGTGTAIVRRLAREGYRVAMLARDAGRLAELEKTFPECRAFPCDVADPAALAATLDAIERDMGSPDVVVHNAVAANFGSFRDITAEALVHNFQVNTVALLHLAQKFTPAMVERGSGAIVVTGNTSALRGKANFAGFAPTKAAQRILAESMARDLGPKGVHVAYVVIDAVIDLEWTRKRLPDAPDSFFIQPDAIADEVWHLVGQDRSAWSFNVEIRPYGETW